MDLQKSQAVQQSAKEQKEAGTIRNEGQSGSGGAFASGEKKQKKENHDESEDGEETPRMVQITDPAVGQHIDITG